MSLWTTTHFTVRTVLPPPCLILFHHPKGADKGASETRHGRNGEVQRGVLGLVTRTTFVLALAWLARDCGTGGRVKRWY